MRILPYSLVLFFSLKWGMKATFFLALKVCTDGSVKTTSREVYLEFVILHFL